MHLHDCTINVILERHFVDQRLQLGALFELDEELLLKIDCVDVELHCHVIFDLCDVGNELPQIERIAFLLLNGDIVIAIMRQNRKRYFRKYLFRFQTTYIYQFVN